MTQIYVARIEAVDPQGQTRIRAPSTPCGWLPDFLDDDVILGATAVDMVATLPSTSRVVGGSALYYPGGLEEPLNAQLDLWRGERPSGLSLPSFGTLEVADPAGTWDRWYRQAWRGARISIFRGQRRTAIDTAGPLARLAVAGIQGSRTGKRLLIRDLGYLFQTPLHNDRYTGAGGLDGDPAVANRVKPIGFGQVFNIAPILIDAVHGIYQADTGVMQALPGARDGGSPLVLTGTNVPNIAALRSLDLAVDEVATCFANSLVRTGGTPQRTFTIDATLRATYTTAGLLNALVSGFGISGLVAPMTTGFATADAAMPGSVNLWLRDETTIGAAIARVAGHTECCVHVTEAGVLNIVPVLPPGPTGPGTGEGLAITRRSLLADPEWELIAPRRGTRTGWRKNWTPQSEADLAPILGAADKRLYGQAHQPVERLAPGSGEPDAQWVDLDPLWVNEADAIAAAVRSNASFGVRQRRGIVRRPLDDTNPVLVPRLMSGTFWMQGWDGDGITEETGFRKVGWAITVGRGELAETLWGHV
jgi:hypothetical protein